MCIIYYTCVLSVCNALNLHKHMHDVIPTALKTYHGGAGREFSSRCLSESKVSNKIMKIALKEVSFTDLVWCIARTKFTLFSMEREVIGKTAVFN